MVFVKQSPGEDRKKPKVEVLVDSDWAGVTDEVSDLRKIFTDGVLTVFTDGVLVCFYCRTQKQTAM